MMTVFNNVRFQSLIFLRLESDSFINMKFRKYFAQARKDLN